MHLHTQRHTHHHKLAKVMSLEVDDETARQWIANGYRNSGWRILIARHGVAMLPELIATMPPSFDGIEYVPELEYIAYLDSAPKTLLPEIWKRVMGQMQPKTAQDVLLAVKIVKPEGMLSIVDFMNRTSFSLPAYHLNIVLQIYADWQKDTNLKLQATVDGKSFPLDHYLVLRGLENDWEGHFTPVILSRCPELAIDAVLHRFADDEVRQDEILKSLKLSSYHDGLFSTMLTKPRLAKLIPQVFGECFETFPESALIQTIHSENIDQDALSYGLSKSSNPLHRRAHAKLVTRVLQKSMDVGAYRNVANCLRSHPRYDLINLLTETLFDVGLEALKEKSLWFIRQVEDARSERLINESGVFIP